MFAASRSPDRWSTQLDSDTKGTTKPCTAPPSIFRGKVLFGLLNGSRWIVFAAVKGSRLGRRHAENYYSVRTQPNPTTRYPGAPFDFGV